jgi:hypothetical protein
MVLPGVSWTKYGSTESRRVEVAGAEVWLAINRDRALCDSDQRRQRERQSPVNLGGCRLEDYLLFLSRAKVRQGKKKIMSRFMSRSDPAETRA